MIEFNYIPHEGQRILHACGARFQTICCGRRWGKTKYAAAKLLDEGGGVAGGDYGWIAPTYLIADRGVEALRGIAGENVNVHGDNPTVAEFDGEAGHVRIYFLSAERPQAILGFGFRGIVVDETAQIPAEVWTTYIRPTLSDHMGWASLISTPRGRNWFFDMFTRNGEPGYASFTFPSKSNPFFPIEEWEEAKRTLPSDVFRQEYMAEFLEDSAGVFRGLERCLTESVSKPTGQVVIGIDLAKHGDYTVLVAMDAMTGACVGMDRFNLIDWPLQKKRIKEFVKEWGGVAWMEVNSVGDAIFDDLKGELDNLRPWVTNNASKARAIQQLSVDIEQGRVSWPRAWQVLTDELKRYEYAISPRGVMTYSAPSGYHDDCVMAFAIANVNRDPYRNPPVSPIVFPDAATSDGFTFSRRRMGGFKRTLAW